MRTSLNMIVAVLLTAFSTSAQDWAKARLEKSPRHLEWVKVKHGEREVNCFIAYPEVKEKATAIVLIHEIFGLTDWVRGMADQLAEAGYIAIAPDSMLSDWSQTERIGCRPSKSPRQPRFHYKPAVSLHNRRRTRSQLT